VGGKEQYSTIAKVSAVGSAANISVYPNPIADKKMQLELNNATLGIHQLFIIGTNGQKLMLPSIKVAGSQQTQTIQLPTIIQPGVYQLQVIAPDATASTKTIIVL
jgi:hypothetical protein